MFSMDVHLEDRIEEIQACDDHMPIAKVRQDSVVMLEEMRQRHNFFANKPSPILWSTKNS